MPDWCGSFKLPGLPGLTCQAPWKRGHWHLLTILSLSPGCFTFINANSQASYSLYLPLTSHWDIGNTSSFRTSSSTTRLPLHNNPLSPLDSPLVRTLIHYHLLQGELSHLVQQPHWTVWSISGDIGGEFSLQQLPRCCTTPERTKGQEVWLQNKLVDTDNSMMVARGKRGRSGRR